MNSVYSNCIRFYVDGGLDNCTLINSLHVLLLQSFIIQIFTLTGSCLYPRKGNHFCFQFLFHEYNSMFFRTYCSTIPMLAFKFLQFNGFRDFSLMNLENVIGCCVFYTFPLSISPAALMNKTHNIFIEPWSITSFF